MPTIVLTPNLTGRDGISRLSRLLVRARRAERVIALHESPERDRFEHAVVQGAGSVPARFAALAVQQAARVAPDTTVIVVHVHLAPAALVFAARGVPVVTMLCGIEAWNPLTWPQRALVQHSHHVVAISQHTRTRFAAANPRPADRDIVVCHPGIDPGDAAVAAMDPDPMLLTVGRMSRDEQYKGHDALLEAWPSVVRAVPTARMEIAGGGDDRDRLEAKAMALGIDGTVDFLGPISNEERDRCYARCTVFAMPSRDEGFGFVFLEAMRAARPCVAMEGSASEIVEPRRTGIVLGQASETPDLAQAIAALLGDRDHAALLGRRGRERFLSTFTTAHVEHRLAGILGHFDRVRITA
jgi:phosphatidylinositol alpha-1,6-mannosyltransferase